MSKGIVCTVAMMVASVALAAQKDDIRGLRIGMTSAQIQDALPGCTNTKVRIDDRSMYCAVTDAEEVLDVDFTNHDRAYVIQHAFASDLTYDALYEDIRKTYGLGETKVNSNGAYEWTLDDGAILQFGQSRLKLGWYELQLSDWRIGKEDN